MRHGILTGHSLVTLILFLGLLLGSCSKKQDSVTGTTPPSETTPGAAITDDARKASLDTLSSFFNSLADLDPAADKLAVLNLFKSRPEF
jgi:hypothetical protein